MDDRPWVSGEIWRRKTRTGWFFTFRVLFWLYAGPGMALFFSNLIQPGKYAYTPLWLILWQLTWALTWNNADWAVFYYFRTGKAACSASRSFWTISLVQTEFVLKSASTSCCTIWELRIDSNIGYFWTAQSASEFSAKNVYILWIQTFGIVSRNQNP